MPLVKYIGAFADGQFDYTTEIDFPLQAFREYLTETEQIMETVKDKIKADKEYLHSVDELIAESYFDFVDHEMLLFRQELYYHSLFISLYSLLERKMFTLCQIAEQGHAIKVKDLSGDGIDKYNKYFKKVLGLDLDFLAQQWNQIKDYNKLRNLLIHRPSYTLDITAENAAIIAVLQSIPHLTVTTSQNQVTYAIVDKQLLLSCCSTISRFLYGVCFGR